MQIMEINMHEIRKLSPRSLWQLAPIRAFIETLLMVIKSGNGGHSSAMYMRMLIEQSESLREKIRENLNMRIKAWIMQCPARILLVHGVIGEAAIRQWRMNRLADYALSKYFGDWKRKWPHGFKRGGFKSDSFENEQEKGQIRKPGFKHAIRDYGWKPFALVKIFNVRRFLYGRSPANTSAANNPKWTQPREQRTHKPIRFTPDELAADAATGREDKDTKVEAEHLNIERNLLTDQRTLNSQTDPPYETKPP
jgi:hypothetical protein